MFDHRINPPQSLDVRLVLIEHRHVGRGRLSGILPDLLLNQRNEIREFLQQHIHLFRPRLKHGAAAGSLSFRQTLQARVVDEGHDVRSQEIGIILRQLVIRNRRNLGISRGPLDGQIELQARLDEGEGRRLTGGAIGGAGDRAGQA